MYYVKCFIGISRLFLCTDIDFPLTYVTVSTPGEGVSIKPFDAHYILL